MAVISRSKALWGKEAPSRSFCHDTPLRPQSRPTTQRVEKVSRHLSRTRNGSFHERKEIMGRIRRYLLLRNAALMREVTHGHGSSTLSTIVHIFRCCDDWFMLIDWRRSLQ